jgi:glutamate synthase (NADPH/NADH) large chain
MNDTELSEHVLHLKGLIEDHVRETGSDWGNQLLDMFEQRLQHFWLVKPKAAILANLLTSTSKAA